MKGRKPKPEAVSHAQGNPGRRRARVVLKDDARSATGIDDLLPLNDLGKRIRDFLVPQLEQHKFIRQADKAAFWRYCETLARYVRVTRKLNRLGGETYETDTKHGRMQRLRPEFIVQERLADRLLKLEDRFALSPMARQQLLIRLAAQPSLFPEHGAPPPDQAPAGDGKPIGFLN